MVKLVDFENVLDIGFGLNALFFVYEVLPSVEERFERLREKFASVAKRKEEATGSTEPYPIGFLISYTYLFAKRVVLGLTILISAVILGVLTICSFVPDAEVGSWVMVGLLALSFGIPALGIRMCNSPIRMVKMAIKSMEKKIEMANLAKWRRQRSETEPSTAPAPVKPRPQESRRRRIFKWFRNLKSQVTGLRWLFWMILR
jgi:translation elongation factor EF-1beta